MDCTAMAGIFNRRAIGKRATTKRQTPVPLPNRLPAHLRRWARSGIVKSHFVEWNGKTGGADFDQAIQLDPKNTKACYNRGMVWEKKRSLRAALADFKMHAQLAPSDPDGCEARIESIEREMTGRR